MGGMISVVTVVFNNVHTIGNTIDSVLGQSYSDKEHVVVDGGSTDGTLRLLSDRSSELDRFVSEPDNGIYDALNKGLTLASGDIVGFLHADDVYACDGVLAAVASVFEDSSVAAVYGDLEYVQKDNIYNVVRHWKSSNFSHRKLVNGWMPPHPTLYVRKEWYNRIGGFNTEYRIAADYLSVLQLFSHPEFKAVYIPNVFVKMRVGGASNRSLRNIIQKTSEDYRALRQTGVGGVGALVFKNLSKFGQFIH